MNFKFTINKDNAGMSVVFIHRKINDNGEIEVEIQLRSQEGFVADEWLEDGEEENAEYRTIALVPNPVKIARLEMTCGGCPSQWEGETSDGKSVYIRLRHGHFYVEIDGHTLLTLHPEGYDGVMSTGEMLKLIKPYGIVHE